MAVPSAYRRRRLSPGVAGGFQLPATLTTALSGDDNDLVYTARNRGTGGNSIRVRYVVSGASTPLSVVVSGKDITVNSETSGASAAVSTAAEVAEAIAADEDANKLVSVDNADDNDGTGAIVALSYTNLAGGTDWVVGQ